MIDCYTRFDNCIGVKDYIKMEQSLSKAIATLMILSTVQACDATKALSTSQPPGT